MDATILPNLTFIMKQTEHFKSVNINNPTREDVEIFLLFQNKNFPTGRWGLATIHQERQSNVGVQLFLAIQNMKINFISSLSAIHQYELLLFYIDDAIPRFKYLDEHKGRRRSKGHVPLSNL